MAEETYYLFKTDDRGFTSVTALNPKGVEKFLEALQDDGEDLEDVVDQFIKPDKKDLQLSYSANSYVLIKGEIIIPKAVKKVTKLEI